LYRSLLSEHKEFIESHQHDDVNALVLKYQSHALPIEWIAAQIKGRQKARYKLPLFYANKSIVFPPSLNLEQSSSEATAQFKAVWVKEIVGETNAGIDLTGGFGIDSFFLSRNFKAWHYIEPKTELLEIVRHNFETLGIDNVSFHNETAEAFLGSQTEASFVYIDPSRRVDTRKVFTLADCDPDITTIQEEILQHTRHLLVKTSPLHDLQEGIRLLKNVRQVIVLSVNNECKEVLFHLEKDYLGKPEILAIELPSNEQFQFTFEEERQSIAAFAEVKAFLYEPNAAILKAGSFKSIGNKFGLYKLHTNTHLYTADVENTKFPGRIWHIINVVKPEKKSVAALLSDGKANVLTRNYPLSPDQLKKQLGVKDGGNMYLIGFTDQKKRLVIAERLK